MSDSHEQTEGKGDRERHGEKADTVRRPPDDGSLMARLYAMIGGRRVMSNVEAHENIFDQGGFSSLGPGNPKRYDFAATFMGQPDRPPIDEQITSRMTPGKASPPAGSYGSYQTTLGQEAAKADVLPRDFQDVTWAGLKNLKDPNYKGMPMIQELNESIERTHRLTGRPRDQIAQRYMAGSIPM